VNDDTLLLRQVHPTWIQSGRVTSQVFKPTPKDQQCLSVYNGDQITPADSWRHFTENLGCQSVGVLSVSVAECRQLNLNARPDPGPFPEHAVIDFGQHRGAQLEAKAKQLRALAVQRGWQYQV
jgi:hypothetical protein